MCACACVCLNVHAGICGFQEVSEQDADHAESNTAIREQGTGHAVRTCQCHQNCEMLPFIFVCIQLVYFFSLGSQLCVIIINIYSESLCLTRNNDNKDRCDAR